jgi:hypothetical protein
MHIHIHVHVHTHIYIQKYIDLQSILDQFVESKVQLDVTEKALILDVRDVSGCMSLCVYTSVHECVYTHRNVTDKALILDVRDVS